MNYIEIAIYLGLAAETDGDGSILREMRWRDRTPSAKEMRDAWIAIQNKEFNAPIDAQLAAIDDKRIRPLAEGDTVYLAKLNKQAIALRAQRKK